MNAGYCAKVRQTRWTNTLGATVQYRLSPEWRTEAGFEPMRTCATGELDPFQSVAPRQIGLDLFWERRY